MNAPNFASALDRPSTKIDRPKPLPPGHYVFLVKGVYRTGESAKKKTPYVEWDLSPQAPGEDVNQDDLAACLTSASGEAKQLADKLVKATFYTTDDAIYRLNDFLDHCQVPKGDDVSVRQRLDGATNQYVVGTISHRPSEDGTQMYAELRGTAVYKAE